MKKCCMILVLTLSFILCACSGIESVVQTPIPTNEIVISEDTELSNSADDVHNIESNQILVSISSYDYECKDPENGTYTILNYYVENPSVLVESNEEATSKINQKLFEINSQYLPSNDAVGLEMDYFTYLQSIAEDNYLLKIESGADLNMLSSFIRMVSVDTFNDDTVCFSFLTTYDDFTEEKYYFDLNSGDMLDSDSIGDKTFSSTGNGYLSISSISPDSSELDKTVIDYISVREDGDDFIIDIFGSIDNAKLSKVGLIEDRFITYSDYWFCNHLADCSVQIKAPVDSDKPDLKFTYETLNSVNNLIITKDTDGSLIFKNEDTWLAVG